MWLKSVGASCSRSSAQLSELSIMVATINNKLTGLWNSLPNKKFFIATWREIAFFQIYQPAVFRNMLKSWRGVATTSSSKSIIKRRRASSTALHTLVTCSYVSRVPLMHVQLYVMHWMKTFHRKIGQDPSLILYKIPHWCLLEILS